YPHRFAVAADHLDGVRAALAREAGSAPRTHAATRAPRVAFVFAHAGRLDSTQGFAGGGALFVDALAQALGRRGRAAGAALRPWLDGRDAGDAAHARAGWVLLQYAAASAVQRMGIAPSEIVGEGVGAFTAAALSGTSSIDEAVGAAMRDGESPVAPLALSPG